MHPCYFLVVVILVSELAVFIVSEPQYNDGDIRLTGGRYSHEGTVLIYHRGEWGSICDRNWSRRDARVVCRQLGYVGAYWPIRGSVFGIGRRRRWLANVRCRGWERRLQYCSSLSWGVIADYRYCYDHRRSAGVICNPRRLHRARRTTTSSTTPTTTTTTASTTTTIKAKVDTTKATPTTVLPKTTISTLKTTEKSRSTQRIPTRNVPSVSSTDTPAVILTSQRLRPRGPQSDEEHVKGPQNNTNHNLESAEKTTVTPPPKREVINSNLRTSSDENIETVKSTPKLQTSTAKPISTTKKQQVTSTKHTITTKNLNTTHTEKSTTMETTHFKQTPDYVTSLKTSPTTSETTTLPQPKTTVIPKTTTAKTTTTTENIMIVADNPNLRRGVWIKDRLLNCYVFLSRSNQVLLSRRGGRPSRISRAEYIQKRWETMVANRNMQSDSAQENTEDTNSQERNEETNKINDEEDQISTSTNSSSSPIVYIDSGEGKLAIQLAGGRTSLDGRIEVLPPGEEKWGVVCGDKWSMRETIVACRHLRNTYGLHAVTGTQYGGHRKMKYFSSIECTGKERSLRDCKWKKHEGAVSCSRAGSVAGVVCANALPDLEPNLYMLENSERLQDRPLYYLQCAMEENCLAPSANNITSQYDRMRATRRLLRFSSVIKNIGTADFRPKADRSQWEWHACHMHYHSMDVFAHYDILDRNGNRVAQGLKASFCLEDSACTRGYFPKYECQNYGHQGISVGCSDNYLAEIDCQWVDVTDLKPGTYKFKMEINPNLLVAELNFDNNVVECDLYYPGHYANIYNCKLKSLL